jgi:hypothetical protein
LEEGRKIYHNGLALYRHRRFKEAIQAFDEVFKFLPDDHAAREYLERARTFLSHPPPAAWDGVFEMQTK